MSISRPSKHKFSLLESKPVCAVLTNESTIGLYFRLDEWEIIRDLLVINSDEKLGAGAFGSVYKGSKAFARH